MEMMLNKIVPEGLPYRHSCEGPDDMVSIVSSIFRSFKSKQNPMFESCDTVDI